MESKNTFIYSEGVEILKRHPFSLELLQDMARFVTGNDDLTLKAGKRWMRRGNTVMLPARDLQNQGKDGLEVLGVFLHETEGHVNNSDSEQQRKIQQMAKEDPYCLQVSAELKKKGFIPQNKEGLPPKPFGVYWNYGEDARVNQILIDEEQRAVAIEHLYKKNWSNAAAGLVGIQTGQPDIDEKLRMAKWKQFSQQIVFYWTQITLGNHRLYLSDLDLEVKKVFDQCLPKIMEAIYTFPVERGTKSKKEYKKARQEHFFKVITSDPIWTVFVDLVAQDIEILGEENLLDEDDEDATGPPEDSDLPSEDQDSYDPQSMESQEQPGKPAYIFQFEADDPGDLISGKNARYYYSNVYPYFDKTGKKWKKRAKRVPYVCPDDFTAIGKIRGKIKDGIVALPLRKGYAVDPDTIESKASIKIFTDQYGLIYLKSNARGAKFEIKFGNTDETPDEENEEKYERKLCAVSSFSEKTRELIEDLKVRYEQGEEEKTIAGEIRKYIIKNKKYSVKFQKKLYDQARNANHYFQLIDQAEAIECYTAACYFTAIAREIGIAARVCSGNLIDRTTVYKDEETGEVIKEAAEVNRSNGHAWVEIWDGAEWALIDPTPQQQADKQEGQESGQPDPGRMINDDAEKIEEDSKMDKEASEQEMRGNEDSEYKDPAENKPQARIRKKMRDSLNRDEVKDVQPFLKNIYEKAFAAAQKYADSLIETLSRVKDTAEIHFLQQQLYNKKRRRRDELTEGDGIGSSNETLLNIYIGRSEIFSEENIKILRPEPLSKSLDIAAAIAIDCSTSMDDNTGNSSGSISNFRNIDFEIVKNDHSKLIHAFITTLACIIAFAKFRIPSDIVLFADRSAVLGKNEEFISEEGEINHEALIKNFVRIMADIRNCKEGKEIGGNNGGNADGMRDALKVLEERKDKKRLLAIVLSDGDGDSNAFLNQNTRAFLKRNKNLYVLGLGLGDDATHESNRPPIPGGRKLSVIESQFYTSEEEKDKQGNPIPGHGRTKGLNCKEVKKLFQDLSTELFKFLVDENYKMEIERIADPGERK